MDRGPWVVFYGADNNVVGVISEDFEHDVVLAVSGDFENWAQKLAYCEWLCEALNKK